MPFELPPLPYDTDALEPAIDAATMRIHHDKHHGGYVRKLNAALEGSIWLEMPIERVLRSLDEVHDDIREAVRNNGGGHFNHTLFWRCLAPPDGDGGGDPEGDLRTAIDAAFGSVDAMRTDFADAAKSRFGSGWAWLCLDPAGEMRIASTANQDTTLMPERFGGLGEGYTPILGLDVWEHAYYLNFQNDRPAYIDAFWSIVNWPQVASNLERARMETPILTA